MTIVAAIHPRASCLPLAGSGEAGRPLFRQVPSARPCPPAQGRATLPGAFRKFLQAGSWQSARPATGDHRAPRKRPWKPLGSICNSRAWPANRFPSIDELTAMRDCAKRGISRNGHRHWLPPARPPSGCVAPCASRRPAAAVGSRASRGTAAKCPDNHLRWFHLATLGRRPSPSLQFAN